MFSKSSVSQSMIDAVTKVIEENKLLLEPEKNVSGEPEKKQGQIQKAKDDKRAASGHSATTTEESHPDEKEDKALVKKMVKKSALKGEETKETELSSHHSMKSEAKSNYTLYHSQYSGAVHHALSHHGEHGGLSVSDDDYHHHVSMGPRKPAHGETVSHNIPAKDAKGGDHMIHMQIYNRGGDHTPYELNTYSSKLPKHKVKESIDEAHLTKGETAEKEKIVHGMKKNAASFKEKYGKRARNVMYATATKMAQKEDIGGISSMSEEEKVRVAGETDMRTKTVDGLRGRMKVPADYHNKPKSYKVGLTVGEEIQSEGKGPESDTVPFVKNANTSSSPLNMAKEMAHKAFKKIKNETMMGKLGTSEEAKK